MPRRTISVHSCQEKGSAPGLPCAPTSCHALISPGSDGWSELEHGQASVCTHILSSVEKPRGSTRCRATPVAAQERAMLPAGIQANRQGAWNLRLQLKTCVVRPRLCGVPAWLSHTQQWPIPQTKAAIKVNLPLFLTPTPYPSASCCCLLHRGVIQHLWPTPPFMTAPTTTHPPGALN